MLKKVKILMLIIIIFTLIFQTKILANTVEYKGESEGLIATPNDFFLNLGELLPGDTKEDIAYIKNSTDEEIEVFFKTEPLEKELYYDDIDYSLLEKIKLKISLKQTKNSEEQMLYEGNLGAELMKEYISLGKYQKGYDGEFIFKIEVPTELRNEYTLSTTKVKWVFAVEKKQNDSGNENVPSEPDNSGNKQDKENTKDNLIKEILENVKTGDNIYYVIAVLILIILINIGITLVKRKKKEKDNM